jgi:hypothetical protein
MTETLHVASWSPLLAEVVERASRLAVGSRCEPVHLITALAVTPPGVTALSSAGLREEQIAAVWAQASELAGLDPLAGDCEPAALGLASSAALTRAVTLARQEGVTASPRHLLVALCEERSLALLLARHGLQTRVKALVPSAVRHPLWNPPCRRPARHYGPRPACQQRHRR